MNEVGELNQPEIVVDESNEKKFTSEELANSDRLIAEDISSKLLYEFNGDFLIKPLELIKVKIQDLEQDPEYATKLAKKEGEIRKKRVRNEHSDVPEGFRRVEREMVAIFQHGIILKTPRLIAPQLEDFKVGDVVIYPHQMARPFDLFKDSALLPPHALIGKYLGAAADINSNN